MKNCNSKIQKILALLLSVMFIFVSCSDIFSGREETGSVTFSLSPELIQAVSNACRAADDDDAPGDEQQDGEKKDGKYKFEIEINGGYKAYDFKSADDVTELKEKIFHFDNIPVGAKIYAEAKIIVGEDHLQWTVMKGKSEEKIIEAGENTLSFNLHQLAMCNVYNNIDSVETLSDIERISVYALPSDSKEATEILELVAEDDEANDLIIKSKLESYKDMLVGDSINDGNSELSPYFTGSYELKDGGEYYFLSLVYIKKGPVYLGHPAFEGTDPELAEKAVTKISFDEINYIYLSLTKMHLEVENVELRFRFWDEEKEEYIKLEAFPDTKMKNEESFDEEFDELAKTAVKLGYTINEDKSGEIQKEGDDYVIYVYFDKEEVEELIDVSLKFYFQNEKGEYVENDNFPAFKLEETSLDSKEFAETVDRYITAITRSGYVYNEEKSEKAEPELVDGVYVVKFYFDKASHGPLPFSISLKPTSGAKVPEISKVHSVTLYAVDATNANKLQTALASTDSSKAAADIINILEKHEETMSEEVSYLQSYSSEVLKAKTSPIVIEDSFTTWGARGKGKSLAIVAVVNYGDGKDIDAFCIGCSSVIEASAESNVVAFDYNPISVPCTISFCLGDDFAEEYTISTALSSFTPTKDETFLETVMAVAADTVEALKEKEYIYNNRYVSELSSGIPYVTLYFVKDESKPTVKEMVLSDAPATIYVGESKSFGAKYVYSDGSEKAAESFRLETDTGKTSDFVEVSDVKDGKITITGKTPGEVTFTVLSDEYEGIAPTFTVTVEATSTSSGIEVNPAEIDTRDLADDFIVTSETDSDGSITLKAEPKTVENGYSYQWYVDGNAVNGATTMSYKWDPEMLRNLGSGVHYVMLQIEFTKGNEKEHYSVTKDSDGNKLILIVTSEE